MGEYICMCVYYIIFLYKINIKVKLWYVCVTLRPIPIVKMLQIMYFIKDVTYAIYVDNNTSKNSYLKIKWRI